MDSSPYELSKQLEGHIKRLLVGQDISALPTDVRQTVTSIKRNLADVRLDVRDYEYAQTRQEQEENGAVAKKRFEQVRQAILTASEYNVFSAIDVAHVTATIEHICSQLT